MAEPKPLPFEMMQATWGENVRRLRTVAERSQAWLGQQINVDQTIVSRLERGIYRFTPELMLGIAAALDQPLEVLFPYPRGYVSMEQMRQAALRTKTRAVAS